MAVTIMSDLPRAMSGSESGTIVSNNEGSVAQERSLRGTTSFEHGIAMYRIVCACLCSVVSGGGIEVALELDDSGGWLISCGIVKDGRRMKDHISGSVEGVVGVVWW